MRSLLVALVLVAAASPRAALAQSVERDEQAARRHFERGLAEYDAHDYRAALADFDAVERFRDAPAVDYNLGRCYDRLERPQEAIAAYERYVAEQPDAADAPAIRERIAALRDRLPPEQRAPAAPLPPPPTRRYGAPVALGAAAVVAAAIGAGLLGSVKSDYDAALAPSGCRPCSDDQLAPLEHRAIAGYALFGVAGALVVVDVAIIGSMMAHRHERSGARAQAWR